MRSIKVKLERSGVTLDGEVLGCAGEKGAVQLEIDVSDIAQEGVDSAFLRYRMPDGVTLEGESAALPDTGPLTVTVPAWAMSERGRVQMQLTLTGADKAVRSYVWSLRVLPSLEVGGTPPEAVRVWLAEVEESIAQALEFCAAVEQVSVTAQTLEAGAPATASGSVSAQEGLRLTLGLPTGAAGPKGDAGAKGEPGAVYTPSVSGEGVLSWSNNGGLSNPESVSIRGPRGDKGDPGAQGETGPQGPRGETGAAGPQGQGRHGLGLCRAGLLRHACRAAGGGDGALPRRRLRRGQRPALRHLHLRRLGGLGQQRPAAGRKGRSGRERRHVYPGGGVGRHADVEQRRRPAQSAQRQPPRPAGDARRRRH